MKSLSHSVVIPIFNERKNIDLLYRRLKVVLEKLSRSYEIIFVDDGSTDGSFRILEKLRLKNKKVKVIRFKRNFGQTAALVAGFDYARGKIIITLDGDLQNDPRDIPLLLEKMKKGYDLVSGWRRKREDPFLSRRLPSYFANWFISWFTGVRLHDYGCTLKAYKRSVVKNINLYGEMHRFIPALASWTGASIAEVPVRHYRRRHGRSKYGLFRTVKVILDLITVKFLLSYSTKPIYIFGSIGASLLLAGFLFGLVTAFQKIVYQVWVHRNPLALLMVFFSILGIQFIMMGLLAEISIRTYHESQKKPTYFIDKVLG